MGIIFLTRYYIAMSNFNGNTGSSDFDDGTADLFVNTLKLNSITTPGLPLKADSNKEVYSTTLDISDTSGLQSALDLAITNPYNGTLKATDFETDNITSVETAIIDLQNSGSGDVQSSATNSKNNAIVRFDGLTGKIVQGYTDNSLAPIVSDEGYLNLYNNFNQTRQNVNANSIQTVYGDRNAHQGNMEFRSLSAKDSTDNITNNRALGAVRFTGGVETTQKYNGAIIEARTAQNWTDAEHGSYFTIKTAKNGEDLISDRLKIDKDGDLIITDNVVAQDLYISGTRTINRIASDDYDYNETNYATQGVSVAGELNSLKEKTIKLTNTGDITGPISTDQTTFIDGQEIVSKKYVDTAVSGIPPADLSALEAKTQKLDADGNIDSDSLTIDVSNVHLINAGDIISTATGEHDMSASTRFIVSAPDITLSGEVKAGNINCIDGTIINVLDPTNLQDAATKNYVDQSLSEISDKTQNIQDTTILGRTDISGIIKMDEINSNGDLKIDSTNMSIDSDLLTINTPIDITDFAEYQGIDYLNPTGINSLAAVGYVNQSIANIPPTDLSGIETDISALQDKTTTLSIVNDDTRINGDFEVEKEVRKIKLYPHSPPGYASELGGITLTGVLGTEYPFIIYDAWNGGAGIGDIDYIRFFVGSASGGEVFNIQPNLMVLNGDLGTATQKVPNIHCDNLYYTQLNENLRNGPIENVNISDTFLLLNNKIEGLEITQATDGQNYQIGIGNGNKITLQAVSDQVNGLMTPFDKNKLDTLALTTFRNADIYEVKINSDNNTTATLFGANQTSAGLMTKDDKEHLDTIWRFFDPLTVQSASVNNQLDHIDEMKAEITTLKAQVLELTNRLNELVN